MDEQENFNEDLSIEEAVATVVADLPEAVQRFVTGPERDEVSLDLTRKYGLHADQAGDFEHAYMFLLLGLQTPEEFARKLRDVGLPETTIQGLATDMNERVFKKLRKEERLKSSVLTAPNIPKPPQVPVMEVGNRDIPPNLPGQYVPPETPPFATQTVPQSTATPPPSPLPAYSVPLMQNAPVLYQPLPTTPIYNNPAPVPPTPETYHQATRTMARDMELATQGYQGQAAQPVFQSAPAPVQYAPVPAPIVPPAQPFVPSPQAAPTPEPLQPNYSSPATAPVRLTPVDRVHTNAPITKEYGSDPYRESIE
ncbi:MAG TPA: hypothetical protein VJA87_00640 [Candidatus Paceibacterota bacterium]